LHGIELSSVQKNSLPVTLSKKYMEIYDLLSVKKNFVVKNV